jgi:hypothetical protein
MILELLGCRPHKCIYVTLDKDFVGREGSSVENLERKAIRMVEPLMCGESHHPPQPSTIHTHDTMSNTIGFNA